MGLSTLGLRACTVSILKLGNLGTSRVSTLGLRTLTMRRVPACIRQGLSQAYYSHIFSLFYCYLVSLYLFFRAEPCEGAELGKGALSDNNPGLGVCGATV